MTTVKKPTKIELEIVKDDKTIKLVVSKPGRAEEGAANLEYNRVFTGLLRDGLLIDAEVEKIARARKLWDDERQAEVDALKKELVEQEKVLAGRKPGVTKQECREIAIKMRITRSKLLSLQQVLSQYNSMTAEAKAREAQFNYLVWKCVKYAETGKPYFASVDDYLSREDDPAINDINNALMRLEYGYDSNFARNFPENKFLLQYKFCNEKLQLVNDSGELVDEKNRRINSDGFLINSKNELINDEGDLIDESGNLVWVPIEFVG